MCWSCVEEYMTADGVTEVPVTDEMIAIAGLIEQFYKLPGCSVGGPLHITVEDTNVEDSSLDFCRRALLGQDGDTWHDEHRTIMRDALGLQILDRLAMLAPVERSVTCTMHHGDRYMAPGTDRTFSYPTAVAYDGDPETGVEFSNWKQCVQVECPPWTEFEINGGQQ